MAREALKRALERIGGTAEEHRPLSTATTFRIGGAAELFVEVPPQAAAEAVRLLTEEGLPVLWIGRGSNLLVGDGGVTGAVVRLTGVPEELRRDGETVTAGAGCSLSALCRAAREAGLAGLEFAFGIPGTVGGGVYMNAGAYGGELRQVLESVEVLRPDGSVCRRTAESLQLGYRHSALMEEGGVVLSAAFRLTPDDPAAIGARMEELMTRRREKQPLEYPSAGSFFKRPEGHFAGALIEQCGLKGYRVGDAQVSEKHAGFVVNRGRATCEQVCRLAQEVRTRVCDETGVTLCPEVRLIGAHWPWEK